MRYTITTMALLSLFLSLVPPASAGPQLSLDSVTILQGGAGTMKMSLSGGTEGYGGINAKLILPDGITVTGVSRGGLLSADFATDWRTSSDEQGRYLSLIAYSRTATFTGAGGLLTLSLRVEEGTPAGYGGVSFTGGNLFINDSRALSNATGAKSIRPAVSEGLVYISFSDDDNDGLPDDWEFRIIDNDPDDGIRSIKDVLPGDDYDGDGRTNMQEYESGSDPVVPGEGAAMPGDIDGDREITLEDVIKGLQTLSGITALNVKAEADINGDLKIGMEEVLYVFRSISDTAGLTYGTALSLDGVDDYMEAPALNLDTNAVTIEAWVKPDGAQSDYSGIVISRGSAGKAVGLYLTSGNELGYFWNGATTNSGWNSGLVLPEGKWSHVALVISPVQARIRMNGTEKTHNAYHDPAAFDGMLNIGHDGSANYFKGRIDEVNIWNAMRTAEEIEQDMYREFTGGEADLVSRYGFELTSRDLAGSNDGTLKNGASYAPYWQ